MRFKRKSVLQQLIMISRRCGVDVERWYLSAYPFLPHQGPSNTDVS